MIVSVVKVDVRAATTNLLMRRAFSCQALVMCGEDTGAADVGGYGRRRLERLINRHRKKCRGRVHLL